MFRSALLLSCALAATTAIAGTVDLSFVNAGHYSDAGTSSWDEKSNLETLRRHFERLAQQLPASQVLKVQVLDVDLAGTVAPSRRDASLFRTVRGRADYPRIQLRYTLEDNGRTLRSGDEWVVDLNYAHSGLQSARRDTPLYYEKRMLDGWFRQRVMPGGMQAAG